MVLEFLILEALLVLEEDLMDDLLSSFNMCPLINRLVIAYIRQSSFTRIV